MSTPRPAAAAPAPAAPADDAPLRLPDFASAEPQRPMRRRFPRNGIPADIAAGGPMTGTVSIMGGGAGGTIPGM